MTQSDPFSTIALVANSQIRYLQIALARKLKERQHNRIHLYCKTPQEVEFYRAFNREGLFSSISNAAVLNQAVLEHDLDHDEVVANAKSYEKKIGCTYNVLAMANRHMGPGYALGGFYHPRSRQSVHTSYLQMLHGFNCQLEFWESEIASKKITSFIGGGKEICVLTRALGIPYRHLTRIRYKNRHYWVENEFRDVPQAREVFQTIKVDPGMSAEVNEPYLMVENQNRRVRADVRIGRLVLGLAYDFLKYLYWVMRGYEKAKGYYLRDRMLLRVRQRHAIRRMIGRETHSLADLDGVPFVFFPLHTEPELSLGQVSPEYYYQLGAISAISRDLPAGAILAVKEATIAAGRRPDNFYDQIIRHKNVVFLNVFEQGHEIVRKAAAVATIVGTAGFEAAVAGKPVITFGQHNSYNFLDHVMVVTAEGQLKRYLDRIFNDEIGLDKARVDGARFLEAIKAVSFDLGAFDYKNLQNFSDVEVERVYSGLLESLRMTQSNQPSLDGRQSLVAESRR